MPELKIPEKYDLSPALKEKLNVVLSQIYNRYTTEEDTYRHYHNAFHTINVVYSIIGLQEQAERDNSTDKLTNADFTLLIIAGCYHDVVVDKGEENEELSADYMDNDLRDLLDGEDREIVRELILSTKTIVQNFQIIRTYQLPEKYEDTKVPILSALLQDADLANLGTGGFGEATFNLALEWGKTSDDDFLNHLRNQIGILQDFSYSTNTARILFDAIKENLEKLRAYMKQGNISLRSFEQYFLGEKL